MLDIFTALWMYSLMAQKVYKNQLDFRVTLMAYCVVAKIIAQ